jgi:hypothetical protein
VPSGANVTLLVPYDSGVFYGARAYDDISVVSPVQLYLDLVSYKGRGEEAAQFLFERVIEPAWSQGQTMENEMLTRRTPQTEEGPIKLPE